MQFVESSTAKSATRGESTFALVRPPGHHAAANRAWRMCYFSKMTISLKRIRPRAKRVLIIDIDLHFGDGTESMFRGDHDIRIVNPGSMDAYFDYLTMDAAGYKRQIDAAFHGSEYVIICRLRYLRRGLWRTSHQRGLQGNRQMIDAGAEKCSGKRFAVLEEAIISIRDLI